MTPDELQVVADLTAPLVKDGAIQRIAQPSPDRFVFSIYRAGTGKTRLLVDLTPGQARLHPTARSLDNPKEAPALCLQLRKLLQGGRIRGLKATPGDRIVTIEVDFMDEGKLRRRRVICEFLPRSALLFVVNERDLIEAASGSARREGQSIHRGETYLPPPPRTSPPTPSSPFARFEPWTNEEIFTRLDGEITEAAETGIDLSALRREIARALKRQYRKIAKIEVDVRKSEGGQELMRQGELLKSAVGDLRRGMSRIEVRDWESDPVNEVFVEIPLNPELSPQDNLDACFNRAKKMLRGHEVAKDRLAAQRRELEALRELETSLEDSAADEVALAAEALGIRVEKARPQEPRKKKAQPRRKPYRAFTSADGVEIWVGRTSADNDELTFRLSRGREWWLHADGYAGSHVVVKTDGELPEQTLLDAATLAVEYSKARTGGKQAVSYTRRKNVTKFKGAAAGKVLLRTHRTILVRVEEARLERLHGAGS